MTLNSNFQVQRDDFSIGEPVFTIGEVKFWAILDSENRFYKYKFSAPSSYSNVLNFFGVQLLNKKIDTLDEYLLKLYQDSSVKTEIPLFEPGMLYIKALIRFLQGGLFSNFPKLNFICLCSQLTEENLRDKFIELKGDLRAIKKQTDITMKCGGCQNSFQRLVTDWEKSYSFYKGRDLTAFIKVLEEALVDFHDFTSIDLVALELVSISFKEGTFQFDLKNNGDDEIETKKLENSLVNFYASKLGEEIPILVTIFE